MSTIAGPSGPPHMAAPPPEAMRKQRLNPLSDLIKTEHAYVDDLANMVMKVAGAWSRNNMPPAQLDKMFHGLEAIYRINKSLMQRLDKIGPTPASPKELGDLLMRWVGEIEPVYMRFINAYGVGLDTWDPVARNPKVAQILAQMARPPSLPPGISQVFGPLRPRWPASTPGAPLSMDALMTMPLCRLDYYAALYKKLLSSTQPGRADHGLLVQSNETLARLLALADGVIRRPISHVGDGAVGNGVAPGTGNGAIPGTGNGAVPGATPPRPGLAAGAAPTPAASAAAAAASPRREASGAVPPVAPPMPQQTPRKHTPGPLNTQSVPRSPVNIVSPRTRVSSTARPTGSPSSSTSGGASANSSFNNSQESSSTSITAGGNASAAAAPPTDVAALEQRVNPDRTVDIFTMQPKKCRLQMLPPNLPFKRVIRDSANVHVSFYPKSDPTGQLHATENAHVFLLTDLFLVCQRMTPAEITRQQRAAAIQARSTGTKAPAIPADMWLMYPPLAGKHLSVQPMRDLREIEVTIMRKETLRVRFESKDAAGAAFRGFNDLISFSGGVPWRPQQQVQQPQPQPQSQQQQPPPMPQMGRTPNAPPSPLAQRRHPRQPGEPPRDPAPMQREPQPMPRDPAPMPGQGPQRIGRRNAPNLNVQTQNLQAQQPGNMHPLLSPSHASPLLSGGPRPSNEPGAYSRHIGRAPLTPAEIADASAQLRGEQELVPPTPSAYTSGRSSSSHASHDLDLPPDMPMRPPSPSSAVVITSQMRCKVFMMQHRAQWRPLGSAHLTLFASRNNPIKQLVIERDAKANTLLASTLLLPDGGVERVGRTGIAVELSDDSGSRTGVVYMIHLKNEQSANGLFKDMLSGSGRAA